MDKSSVYVPLDPVSQLSEDGEEISRPATLVALARETGETLWTYTVETQQPPVLVNGLILIAAGKELQAIDSSAGERVWSVALAQPVRAPMLARGSLVLALLEGDELIAFDIDRRQVAWRRSIGKSGQVLMTADDKAAYLATAGSRAMRVMLADGELKWESRLEGELTEPTVDRDRLFVGSDANRGSLWALNVETGRAEWAWRNGVFAGAVVGTAVEGNTVYVVSKDNMLRALNRGNGSQRWQKSAGMRPTMPPQLLEGLIAVSGARPTLATFRTDTGATVSNWSGPATAILRGPMLLDTPEPLKVSIVALFRDPRIVGLTPAAMLFKDPPLAPLTTLPGRALQRER